MQQVAHTWDAQLYSNKHAYVYDYGKSLIELLDPKPHERILDLGCGSGQLTSEISVLANNVVGVDKSEEMIGQARLNFPSIEFQVGDAVDFEFGEKFDAIFSNAALHWVVAHEEAIANMYRNLKNGGRITVEFGGKDNISSIVKALRESLSQKGFMEQAEIELWYFPSIGEYTSALEAKGFKVTFAQWYDRPTVLVDEETGLKDWIRMFGKPFFTGLSDQETKGVLEEVQKKVRPVLFRNGKWFADYKRIRIIAEK